MIDLSLLSIDRVVVHHIPSRDSNKGYVPPRFGTELVYLANPGVDMFTRRFSKSLSSHSHGIQAEFHDRGAQSFFRYAVQMMDGTEEEFFDASREVAEKLARAQLTRSLSASKLIVISGKYSDAELPFSAVVKSDLQDGLREGNVSGKQTVDYLSDIFFAESQKLYKIGIVQKTSSLGSVAAHEHFALRLFDHLMTGTETRGAAAYFYNDFLGADVASSDRHCTRMFFEKTKEFFEKQNLSRADFIDLDEALRTEMRSQKQTLSIKGFSDEHLKPAMRSSYIKFMEQANVSTNAITKDTEYIKTRLRRRRKIVFSSGVMITTPADGPKLVDLKSTADGTTTVTIAGTVETQE